MNTKKIYYGMLGLTGILLISIFVALFFSFRLLKSHSDGLVEVKLQSRLLDNQQASLTKAQKSIKEYSELNEITKAIVPQDKDQAKTVREITNIANELNIKISSISFPASNLGSATTSKKAKATETQVIPVKGIKKVYELQITLQQDKDVAISYKTFLQFLEKLESNRRTAQVKNISISPSENSDKLSFNLVLSTYIKP